MTKIAELLERGPTLSLEFFPPKTEEGEQRLRQALRELESLEPSFVSITYGAGGSTRDGTERLVMELHREGRLMPMPHLTCIGHRREEVADILRRYEQAGLENVLALHGDPPRDNPDIDPGDLRRAVELVGFAREIGDFCIGVAAHPEGHPQAPDRDSDRRHQAAKLAVADFGVTQFFFDAEDYLRLVDDLHGLGVDTPIIAGVIPITDAKQVARFAAMSGADFPVGLAQRLEAAPSPEEVRRIGIEVATELSQRLLDEGAPGLHLYTLNRSEAPRAVFENLGLAAARA